MAVARSCAAQNAEARPNLWWSFFKATTLTADRTALCEKKKGKDILGKETMFKALEEFEPDIKVNGALIFFLEKILDLLLPFHGEREKFWTNVLWRKKKQI